MHENRPYKNGSKSCLLWTGKHTEFIRYNPVYLKISFNRVQTPVFLATLLFALGIAVEILFASILRQELRSKKIATESPLERPKLIFKKI